MDSPFVRNAQGTPYLPGSMVKGRVRDAMRELHEICGRDSSLMPDPVSWFGPDNRNGGNRTCESGSFDRHNTRVVFDDFQLTTDIPAALPQQTRIARDEDLGAAREAMMRVAESAAPSGKEAQFTGRVHFDTRPGEDEAGVQKVLIKAIRFAGCFGALTSIGYGELTNVTATLETPAHDAGAIEPPNDDRIFLKLVTSDLFCISESRVGENLFESSHKIPGAVLKGAFAAQYMRDHGKTSPYLTSDIGTAEEHPLAHHLDKIRFSYALPVPDGGPSPKLPVVPPISLARYLDRNNEEQWMDFAVPGAAIPADARSPISFSVDWKAKTSDAVGRACGEFSPRRQLRVRTAIDPAFRRAQENMLFSYEMVDPTGFSWLMEIDFSRVPCQYRSNAKDKFLAALGDGFRNVGKTKARFQATVFGGPDGASPTTAVEENPDLDNGVYRLTLQTPGIVADPRLLTMKTSPCEMHHAYAEAIQQLSGGALELQAVYARHSLAGGLYLYKRFQEGRVDTNGKAIPYEPYLITKPGSVLVVRPVQGKENEAREHVENWRRNGIPLPPWAVERFARNGLAGDDWRNCPYLPSNGYAAVLINLASPMSIGAANGAPTQGAAGAGTAEQEEEINHA